jgi:hypothetical protein
MGWRSAIRSWFEKNFTVKGLLAFAFFLYSVIPDSIARHDFWAQQMHTILGFVSTPLGRIGLACLAALVIWADHRSVLRKSKGDRTLKIKRARYGVGGDRYVDVTTLLRAYIKGNRISVLVTNWTMCSGRDPYYGDQKHLVVEYSVGNGPLREIVRLEQDQLELPEEDEARPL